MESIQKEPILKFHPDTLVAVRKLYNLEKKENMDEAVNVLEDWVKKQDHFTKKDYSRNYLERLIIQLKGSVERAKVQLDRVCTIRTLLPKYFTITNVEAEFEYLRTGLVEVFLPNPTKEHYRVYVTKFYPKNTSSKLLLSMFRIGVLYCEYVKSYDYVDGVLGIVDLRDINVVNLVANIDFVELREIALIVTQCYQIRIKGIHLVTESTTVELLAKALGQVLSAKIASRIQTHKNFESVYKYVPKEDMPQDFGGSEKSLSELYNDWARLFKQENSIKYFKEMSEARTNESLRQTDIFNDQYMGTVGTFRRLIVD